MAHVGVGLELEEVAEPEFDTPEAGGVEVLESLVGAAEVAVEESEATAGTIDGTLSRAAPAKNSLDLWKVGIQARRTVVCIEQPLRARRRKTTR